MSREAWKLLVKTTLRVYWTKQLREEAGEKSTLERCHPRGGTLKFSVYIGEADFFGVKILNFRIFFGFSEKLVIF